MGVHRVFYGDGSRDPTRPRDWTLHLPHARVDRLVRLRNENSGECPNGTQRIRQGGNGGSNRPRQCAPHHASRGRTLLDLCPRVPTRRSRFSRTVRDRLTNRFKRYRRRTSARTRFRRSSTLYCIARGIFCHRRRHPRSASVYSCHRLRALFRTAPATWCVLYRQRFPFRD